MQILDTIEKAKIAFVHLGCEKNRIDTEHMMGMLSNSGYKIEIKAESADYIIVNTCSFITSAKEESVNTILKYEKMQKKIIITGCLAQQYKGELLKELPLAQAVVGTGDYHNIVNIIENIELGEKIVQVSNKPEFISNEQTPRIRTGYKHVAYLRVSEGCDYMCSFCIIPKLRGRQRSRPIESLVKEAQNLINDGVKELIIIAQNSTAYGTDIYQKPSLAKLLSELAKLNISWIRIHYAYPTGINDELLDVIVQNKNILAYFDIPLQHSHPDILKAMNRPFQEETTHNIIKKIRNKLPHAVIRTTFITGFPGEKKEHFYHLLNFIQETKFNHIGVFTYSEDDTLSSQLPDKVSPKTMIKRKDEIMALQQKISNLKNKEFINKELDIIIDSVNTIEQNNEYNYIGRGYNFAPEIDGVIYLKEEYKIGEIYKIKITDADIYDLFVH